MQQIIRKAVSQANKEWKGVEGWEERSPPSITQIQIQIQRQVWEERSHPSQQLFPQLSVKDKDKPDRKLFVQVDDISLPSFIPVVEVPVLLPDLSRCFRIGRENGSSWRSPRLIQEHCSEVGGTSSLPPYFPKPKKGGFNVENQKEKGENHDF